MVKSTKKQRDEIRKCTIGAGFLIYHKGNGETESGWADATADDWFYKDDVLEAVNKLKESSNPQTKQRIDEIFGDLTKDFDDILEEME